MDASKIAAQRGIQIIRKNLGYGLRGSSFRKNGNWIVILNNTDSVERQNFTLAHELSEIELDPRIDLDLNEKHKTANRMASELLLPEDNFKSLVFKYGLYTLKKYFPLVSFEAIARRILMFQPSVLSIYDNGFLSYRIGSSGMNFSPNPLPVETETVHKCYKKKMFLEVNNPPLVLKAYYIDESNLIERVILISEVDDPGL